MLTRRVAPRRLRLVPLRSQAKALRSASGCSELAFPKGKTRARRDEELHAEEVEQIRVTREKVFKRDAACRVCNGARRRLGQCLKREDEMNEMVPRSKTRGLPPASRFNVHNCHRACDACHRDITENRIEVVGDADVPGGLVVRPKPAKARLRARV